MPKRFNFGQNMTAAALTAILSLLLGTWYGFQWRVPESQINVYFRVGTLGFAALLLGLTWLSRQEDSAFCDEPPAWFGCAISVASLLQSLYFYGAPLGVSWGWIMGAVAAPCGACLLAGRTTLAVAWLLLTSVVVCGAVALNTPLDVKAANMLPIIVAACSDAAASINPYGKVYTGIATLPLYYFPALWAPYCLPNVLGIDLRWLNLTVFIGMLGVSMAFFKSSGICTRWVAFVLPLFVSPTIVQMLIHGHLWSYWLALMCALWAISRRRSDWAAALLAAAIGMRQLAVFLAIPLAGVIFGPGPRETLRRALIGFVVLLVLLAPAIALTDDFFGYFFFSIAAQSAAQSVHVGNPQDQIALSGFLAPAVPAWILQALQVVVALCGFAAVRRSYLRGSLAQSYAYAGLTYLVVVGLNPFLNRYFYVPGLLLLTLGAGLRDLDPSDARVGTSAPPSALN